MKKTMYAIALFLIVSAINPGAATAAGEVLMYLPFQKGTKVHVVQGQDTNFTHKGKMKYAYDFDLNIYSTMHFNMPTYGKAVLSPLNGEVVEVRTGAPDFQLNNVSVAGNNYGWGNTLLLRDHATGKYVRMSHFRNGSITLNLHDEVVMGQKLGEMGQSGFSTDPHLHLHVQKTASSTDQSIQFGFIEGVARHDRKIRSELDPGTFVVDDFRDKSMSHELIYYKGYKTSSWREYPIPYPNEMTGWGKYYVRWKKSKKPWYKWRFAFLQDGFFAVYAKFNGTYKKDPKAQYEIGGEGGFGKYTVTVDQRQDPYDHWNLITMAYFKGGRYHYIKLRPKTWKKYLEADSIKFQRIW